MIHTFPEGTVPGPRPKDKEKNSLMDVVTAMSRSLAVMLKRWKPEQKKLFIMCLTQIRWSKSGNSNSIILHKKEIVEALGLRLDANHQSVYIRDSFQKLRKDSDLHWTDPKDKERYDDGALITNVRGHGRGIIEIVFNPEYMPELENLVQNTPYLTMWSTDVYRFKSKFTFALYEELREHYDSRYSTNTRTYSTKQLKEIFDLDKDKYCRKDGSFDRSNFEKRCLDVAISEINESETIAIILNVNSGKCYEKIKKNGRIAGYRFKYLIRTVHKDPDIVSVQEEGQVEGQLSMFDDEI